MSTRRKAVNSTTPVKRKNPAFDSATGEWVLDRGHEDPIFVRRTPDAGLMENGSQAEPPPQDGRERAVTAHRQRK